MEKTEIKKIVKNEVTPYLIGLRNEVKQTNELLDILDGSLKDSLAEVYKQYAETFEVRGKEIEETNKKQIDIKVEIKGDEIEQRLTGNLVKVLREKLPKKGKDYFTQREIIDFKKAVTPKFGVDYKNGDDGKTPVKGKDYFTEKEHAEFIKAVTPIKGIHYKDGAPGVPGKNGKNGTEISAEEIRNRLESLRGKNRLSISAIKDLEERLKRLELGSGGSPTMTGASSGGGHIIQGNYVVKPNRGNLNFIGPYVSVIDEPSFDRTSVIIGGAGVGGSQGDFQWNNGGSFSGSVPAWTDGTYVFFGQNGGVDYTQFDSSGFQTMSGNAKVWKEVSFDLMPRSDGVFQWEANKCEVQYGFADSDFIPFYVMPNDDTFYLPFQWEVPHDWEKGTNIYVHIHYSMRPNELVQLSGQVSFEVNFTKANPQQDCESYLDRFRNDNLTLNGCLEMQVSSYEWLHYKTVFEDNKDFIDGTGMEHSTIIRGVFHRGHSDNLNYPIIPLSIDFHYLSNKLGTPQPVDGRVCNI